MSDAKQAEQLWLKAHEHVKEGNLAQAVRDLSSCYEMLKALKDPRLAQVHRRWVDVHKLYLERKARAKAAAAPGAAQGAQAAQAQAAQAQAAQAQAAQAQAAQAQAAQAQAAQAQAAQAKAAQQAPAQAAPAAKAEEPIRVEPRFSQAEARTLGEQAEAAANAGNLEQAIALYARVVEGHPTNELAKERIAELKAAAARKAEMSGAERRPAHFAATLPAGPVMAGATASGPKTAGVVDDVAFLEQLLAQVQERRRAL